MRNYDTKVFLSLAKQLETLFSYFRIFPSFAKRSKLDETVTCFVQFRISLNKKNTKLSTLAERRATSRSVWGQEATPTSKSSNTKARKQVWRLQPLIFYRLFLTIGGSGLHQKQRRRLYLAYPVPLTAAANGDYSNQAELTMQQSACPGCD